MSDLNMTDKEKEELRQMNAALNQVAANILAVAQDEDRMPATRKIFQDAEIMLGRRSPFPVDHEGDVIEFDVPKGRNLYRYYEDRKTKTQYCTTTVKDIKGWYWTWTYKPIGPGSRSGKAKRFKLVNLVRFRKKKDAIARAEKRYNKATSK